MQTQPTREEWIAIMKALAAPFPADDIELRYEKAGKIAAGQSGAVLAYVTARAVQDRLDDVVPGAWEFTYDVLSTGPRDIEVVKGRLEVYGLIREDVGDAPNLEKSKGAVSDAMKRAAVQWGIGRYLYKLPKAEARADGNGRIPASFIESWAKAYNRRFGLAGEAAPVAVAVEEAAPVAPVAATPKPSSRPVAAPSPARAAETVDQLLDITSPQAAPDGDTMTFEEATPVAPQAPVAGRNELGVPTGGLGELYDYATKEIGIAPGGWNKLVQDCKREPDAIRAHFNHMRRTALEGRAKAGKVAVA